MPSATHTYELTGFERAAGKRRFAFDDWTKNDFEVSRPQPRSAKRMPISARHKRLIGHVRMRYRSNDLSVLLQQGLVESLALPGETCTLAFTPGLLTKVFRRASGNQPPTDLLPDAAAVLGGAGGGQGGYVDVDEDGHWWQPSGRVFSHVGANVANPAGTAAEELIEARQHFFVARKFADPFGQSATIDYDLHVLVVAATQDALENGFTAEPDYRVLQPRLVTDPNGNRSAVAYDLFGGVAGPAVMGKEGEDVGDTLHGFDSNLPEAALAAFYQTDAPHMLAADLFGATTRTVYDLDRFRRTRLANPTEPEQWLPPIPPRWPAKHVGATENGQRAGFGSASAIPMGWDTKSRRKSRRSQRQTAARGG